MKPKFVVTKLNLEVTEQTSHLGNPYKQGAVIRYFCMDGYESVNQTYDVNITCSGNGQWEPRLTPCIRKFIKIFKV